MKVKSKLLTKCGKKRKNEEKEESDRYTVSILEIRLMWLGRQWAWCRAEVKPSIFTCLYRVPDI